MAIMINLCVRWKISTVDIFQNIGSKTLLTIIMTVTIVVAVAVITGRLDEKRDHKGDDDDDDDDDDEDNNIIIQGLFEYNSNLFNDRIITKMNENFDILLKSTNNNALGNDANNNETNASSNVTKI